MNDKQKILPKIKTKPNPINIKPKKVPLGLGKQ